MSKTVQAICTSDWHICENPPIVRSAEVDWFKVQAGYFTQLRWLQQEYKVPILVAGDLFDRWNSSAHLINHVLTWLEGLDIYAIPGNHDLPNHNYQQLFRSAYWTLVEAKVIKNLTLGMSYEIGPLTVWPFPHGYEVTPPNRGSGLTLHVALIHDYIWTKETGHKEAPANKRLGKWQESLWDYDVAVFGDNHRSLYNSRTNDGGDTLRIFNCGTLMRRTTDERTYKPCVGLLHTDGSVVRHFLDTSRDEFLDLDDSITSKLEEGLEIDLAGFTQELEELHMEKRDFAKLVIRLMEKYKVPQKVRTVILRALGARKAG